MREEKGEQFPIYYIDQVPKRMKSIFQSYKNSHYCLQQGNDFKAHTIEVRRNYPLKKILYRHNILGILTK